MDDAWNSSFNLIKEKHDNAYKVIEQAIRNEEDEVPEVALINYRKGIELIDDALATPVALPEHMDDTWKLGCQMIHKMKRTRGEVVTRIASLSRQFPEYDSLDSFEFISASEVKALPKTKRPRTYTELAQALNDLEISESNSSDELELLFSCDGVHFYHIKPDGSVTTSIENSILRVVRIAEDESKNLDSTVFLQIIESSKAIKINNFEDNLKAGSCTSQSNSENDEYFWIYPLVPGVSPCYRTEYNAFIFPDLQSNENGAAIGIVIPSPADEIVLEILESLLHGICKQEKIIADIKPKTAAAAVSQNIVKGAFYLSNGIIKGAEKAGQLLSYGTPILISKLNPAQEDAPPSVSQNVKQGMEIAKAVTGTAVSITGYISNKVGSATMALGRFLAPHIQQQGSRLLSHGLGISQDEALEKVNGVLTIAAGAVEGFGTVYSGLEKSASILGENLANNSIKIIEHTYGESAGNVAGTTFDTVGNIINISQNVNYISPKGIVKKTAKNAGKAIVEDYYIKEQPENKYVAAGTLYPDLSAFAKEINKGESSKF